jgi:hypothetical protein
MTSQRTLGFLTLFLALGLAACVEVERDDAVVRDGDGIAENAPDEGFQDPSDEAMRDEIMEEQFEELSVLQREMTGDWRDDAREMMLDFENRRYEGFTPQGDPLEGNLRVVDEGDGYVTFMVDDETLTARTVGDGQILLSAGPDDAEGLRFRR